MMPIVSMPADMFYALFFFVALGGGMIGAGATMMCNASSRRGYRSYYHRR
jgi:hypothetical protein